MCSAELKYVNLRRFFWKVQEKHHDCYTHRQDIKCSCAVAVRSGKDVFVIDVCNSKTVISFPSCEDKVLNVIKKNDKYYKVIKILM